ncbi:MAG: archaeoflavoprotein AfpA [Candidatus Hodarchaeota archaeon]
MVLKIAWGITGAGDYLPETIQVMKEALQRYNFKLTVFLSKAAIKVVKMYHLWKELEQITPKLLLEKDANTPFISGPLQKGAYNFLLVVPATANTVAKIVVGIADTLVTNSVSQAHKGNIPIYILPVDQNPGSLTTVLPSGDTLTITTREVDIVNVEKLKAMKGITTLRHPSDIFEIIEQYLAL